MFARTKMYHVTFNLTLLGIRRNGDSQPAICYIFLLRELGQRVYELLNTMLDINYLLHNGCVASFENILQSFPNCLESFFSIIQKGRSV